MVEEGAVEPAPESAAPIRIGTHVLRRYENPEIYRTAARYCPGVQFVEAHLSRIGREPRGVETYVCEVDYYDDYRLVCLKWPEVVVIGFYAPGDFRPLDVTGDAIERLNAAAPLKLTAENAGQYLALRLATKSYDSGSARDSNRPTNEVREVVPVEVSAILNRHDGFRALMIVPEGPAEGEIATHPPSPTRRIPATRSSWRVHADGTIQHDESGDAPIEMMPPPPYEPVRMWYPVRHAPSLAADDWKLLLGGDRRSTLRVLGLDTTATAPGERHALVTEFGEKTIRVTGTLVREAVFPTEEAFYPGARLIEVIAGWPHTPDVAYAVIPLEGPRAHDAFVLDRTSDPVHEVNSAVRLDLSSRAKAAAYLRFFCAAVTVEGERFWLPMRMRQLPIENLRDGAGREELLAHAGRFGLGPSRVVTSDPPPTHLRFGALLVYSGALFDSTLDVGIHDGVVEMKDDSPLATLDDRLLLNSRFPRGRLYWSLVEAASARARARAAAVADARTPSKGTAPVAEGVLRFGDLPRRPEGQVFRGQELGQAHAGPIEFVECTFKPADSSGVALDLSGITFTGDLTFTKCTFIGALVADRLTVKQGNLTIQGCRIGVTEKHGLTPVLAHAVTTTDLPPSVAEVNEHMSRAARDESRRASGRAALSLNDATIGGDLLIGAFTGEEEATVVLGDVSAEYAVVDGRANLGGTYVRGDVSLGHSTFKRAVSLVGTAGDPLGPTTTLARFRCSSFPRGRSYAGGLLSVAHVTAHGDFIATYARIDAALSFKGSRVSGKLRLSGSVLGTEGEGRPHPEVDALLLSGCSIETALIADWKSYNPIPVENDREPSADGRPSLTVNGNVAIVGSPLLAAIRLRGVRISGSVSIRTSKCGEVVLGVGGAPISPKSYILRHSDVGSVELLGVEINGELNLAGLRVTGDEAGSSAGCVISQCTIKRDLVIGDADLSGGFAGGWERAGEEWKRVRPSGATDGRLAFALPGGLRGGLRMTAIKVEHSLRLEGLRVPGLEDESGGAQPLIVSRNAIGQDLVLTDVRSTRGGIDLFANEVGQNILLATVEAVGAIDLKDCTVARDLQVREDVRCDRMTLEMTVCKGDVDLSRLRGTEAAGPVSIGARGLSVSGELWLARPPEAPAIRVGGPDDGRSSALPTTPAGRCFGDVDLTSLKANRVTLSGREDAPSGRVTLERCEVGQVRVLQGRALELNLTGASIGSWSFADGAQPTATELAELFRRAVPFDAATWTAVERKFRDEARDADADRLYFEMRRAETSRKLRGPTFRGRLSGLPSWLWGASTKYGTQIRRPLAPWAGVTVVTFLTLLSPQNVRPATSTWEVVKPASPAPIADSTGQGAIILPEHRPDSLGKTWRVSDALALTVRYAVPLIQSGTHDRWEASENRMLGWRWLTPELIAWVNTMFGWTCLPFVVIYLGAKAVRGVRD